MPLPLKKKKETQALFTLFLVFQNQYSAWTHLHLPAFMEHQNGKATSVEIKKSRASCLTLVTHV